MLLTAGEIAEGSRFLARQAHAVQQLSAIGVPHREAGKEVHRLAGAQPGGQRRRLQLHANLAGERLAVSARIHAQHRDTAAIGIAQAFEAFNRGCFAGAVRPHHAEDLAFLDVEGDMGNGDKVAIGFAQVVHRDDSRHTPPSRQRLATCAGRTLATA